MKKSLFILLVLIFTATGSLTTINAFEGQGASQPRVTINLQSSWQHNNFSSSPSLQRVQKFALFGFFIWISKCLKSLIGSGNRSLAQSSNQQSASQYQPDLQDVYGLNGQIQAKPAPVIITLTPEEYAKVLNPSLISEPFREPIQNPAMLSSDIQSNVICDKDYSQTFFQVVDSHEVNVSIVEHIQTNIQKDYEQFSPETLKKFLDNLEKQKLSDEQRARYKNRLDCLREDFLGDRVIVHYELQEDAHFYLDKQQIDSTIFKSCNGNKLQQLIHKEFIDIVVRNEQVYRSISYGTNTINELINEYAYIGAGFNKLGNVLKSITIADACWFSLDCVQALGEGIFDGVSGTFLHPIDTATNFVLAPFQIARQLGHLTVEIGAYVSLRISDPKKAQLRWEEFIDTCAQVIEQLRQDAQDWTVHDGIRFTTTIMVEGYLQAKLLTTTGKLFSIASAQAVKVAKNVKDYVPETSVLLRTAEGVEIAIAQEAFVSMSMAVDKVKKGSGFVSSTVKEESKLVARNMNEFFDKIPFGKDIEGKVQKVISVSRKNGRQIYQVIKDIEGYKLNKGDYIYLDTLHCNHLEVFDKKGNASHVLNLFGKLMQRKSNVAVNQVRTIKV